MAGEARSGKPGQLKASRSGLHQSLSRPALPLGQHQLVHFADLRNVYRVMREALICAKHRAFAIPTCSPSVASTTKARPWLA